MTTRSRSGWALALLLVLPAGFNEFLTGATPLQGLVSDPIVLPFVLGFYGGGALLIRELAVRWRKGWPSVLAMGAAFGIVLEGLAARTFFGDTNGQVGLLAAYGHFFGVNWVWAVANSFSDALYTIAVPIVLVSVLFPEIRDRPLIPGWGMGLALVSFVAFPLGLNLATAPHPAPVLLLGTVLVVLALFLVASRLPARFPVRTRTGEGGPPRVFFGAGIALTLSILVVTSVLVLWIPPSVDILAIVLVYVGASQFVMARMDPGDVEPRAVALAAGLYSVWFVVDVLRAVSGEPLILLVTALYILLFRKAWMTATAARTPEEGRTPPTPA